MPDLFNTDADLFLVGQYVKRKSACILSPEYGRVIGFDGGLVAEVLQLDAEGNKLYLQEKIIHSTETIEHITEQQYQKYQLQLIKLLK